MNTNHISIIKNSEENHMSCLRSCVKKNRDGRYLSLDNSLEIELYINHIGNTSECVTSVKNVSDGQIDLNQLSSAFVEVENKGSLLWYDNNKYRIHFCRNAWLGEGQWQTSKLSDMGLYQVFDNHQHNCFINISSKGSQTTNRFYPLVLLEDLELGETHYFEIKSSSAWYIELCVEYNENNEETLFVFMSGTCEKNDGWHKTLLPQEKYKSLPAIYGTVKGGFEQAVAELTDYKRQTSKAEFANKLPPVCFNDYMNCCWAMPSAKKTIALIDKAAELGVEIFCMDSGWQASLLDDNFRCIGDWAVAKERFMPKTLKEIVKYANSKGLKFGAWLEIEGVQIGTCAYTKLDKYILKRRGKIIGTPKSFYDFRSNFVCDKIEKVFDMLYDIGVRYIKNDYNQTVGIGCDGADSLSEGLIENARAFCKFIDKIRSKYSDLIIENCGSGAMRCDSETLSHFHLQSVSDQEVYSCNPSIISGILACLPPEKAGIWSYPYPVRYAVKDRYEITAKQIDEYSDGKQTIFNMVNSMVGLMYLSGRIDASDELNCKLIKDGIDVYKRIREDIPKAYPIYPLDRFRIGDCGVFCLGLSVPKKHIIYTAVWKINCEERSSKIGFAKYGGIESIQKLYPDMREYKISAKEDEATVELPEGNTAMLFLVKTK